MPPSNAGAARPNIALVEAVYAAFARRDLRAVLDAFAADIVLEQSREVPWGGTYHGHAGAEQFVAALTSHVTSRVVVQHCIDAGETVVAVGRTQGTVNATGRAFDVPIAHVWTLRAGRVVRIHYCIDHPTMCAALR